MDRVCELSEESVNQINVPNMIFIWLKTAAWFEKKSMRTEYVNEFSNAVQNTNERMGAGTASFTVCLSLSRKIHLLCV